MREHWIRTLAVVLLVVLGIGLAAVSIMENKQKLAVNDATDAVQQKRLNDATAAKAAAQSGEVVLKLVERRMADLAATKATTSTTAPPTTVAPTTTPVAATHPSNPPPPPNPCPKSREEVEFIVGGNANNWSVLPETDGQGWKYKGNSADLTHPGYGRLDTPLGQVSSGTVRVTEATLWWQATGGEPAESLVTPAAPARAAASTPTRSPAPAASAQPAPTAPAAPAPAQPAPTAPAAPSCPTFGGAATSPLSDTGCQYKGDVKIAKVPSGFKAIYFDDTSKTTLTGCSGQEIATGVASFYQDDGSCVSSPPPAPSTPPTTTPTPPPNSGGTCPMGSPVSDGGCFVEGWPAGTKVPAGWWANTEVGRIDSGKTVTAGANATLYRNGS